MRFLRYELERLKPPIEAISSEGGPDWVRVSGGDLPADLYLHFAWTVERQWICDRVIMLAADGTPSGLSTAAMRAIPLSAIIDEALLLDPLDFWTYDEQTQSANSQSLKDMGFDTAEIQIIGQASQERLPEHLRVVSQKGPTEEQLRLFAATYKLMSRSRNPVQETLRLLASAGLTISRATANRWRTMAQNAEPPMLPPSSPLVVATRQAMADQGIVYGSASAEETDEDSADGD